MGVPIPCQNLNCSVRDVLRAVRKAIKTGSFDFKHWDHGNDNYSGLSSKQAWIAGAALLYPNDRDERKSVTWEDAKSAITDVILGD